MLWEETHVSWNPYPISPQAQLVQMQRTPASRTPAMGQPPAVCFPGVGPSVSAPWDAVVPSVRQVRSKGKDEGLGSNSWFDLGSSV